MNVSNVSARVLESALNAYIALDPDTQQRVRALAGKVVAMELTGINLTLFLVITTDRIQVRHEHSGAADARLTGTPLAFARLAVTNDREVLHAGDVRISGDTDLGQQLRDILAAVDIDWEEHLSKFTGDAIAHQVGNVARGAAKWARDTSDALVRDTSEYLRYEKELLPDRAAVEDFMHNVDVLRDDVERLDARVQRLRAHAQRSAGDGNA